MCGRYAATLPPEMLVELFNLLNRIDYSPRYNIRPTDPIVAVWQRGGERTAHLPRWGFVPAGIENPKEFPLLINARAEGLRDKPSFRNAVKSARCVIPADGYYEWMTAENGRKQPYFIYPAVGRHVVFAGLYSTWTGPQGEPVETAAIVTVAPNLDVSGVHDRMPAMLLTPDAVDAWLDTDAVPPDIALQFVVPPPPGALRYHIVSKQVGRNDAEGAHLIRALTPEEAAIEAGAARPRRKAALAGQLSLF
ncbi:MAG TPA: SOS response-associated peptidase [Alphaproteobacteria bacterium]|nr:SOS response-associated peptidase [Alphaproteobacteria bacterium]